MNPAHNAFEALWPFLFFILMVCVFIGLALTMRLHRLVRANMKSPGLRSLLGFFAVMSAMRPLVCATDYATRAIEDRIAQVVQVSAGFQIDGHDGDWSAIPAQMDVSGDAGGDASRDLVSTRVVANAAGLYVTVRTLGTPSQENYAFGFYVDFADLQYIDLEFSATTPTGCNFVYFTPEGGSATELPIQGVQVGIADCVEWFIPWDSLKQALPPSMTDKINGPSKRPWLRVTPYTWNLNTGLFVDYGAAAACFVVPATAGSLDPPLPEAAPEKAELPIMMEGQSFLIEGAKQGPYGVGDHTTNWCYDLTTMDATHSPSTVRNSTNNSDYYAFGRKLFAPVAGTLSDARDTVDDHDAFCGCGTLSNYAFLHYQNYTLWLVHNKKSTLVPSIGQNLSPGAPIAQVGDTGPSGWAHVHMQVQSGPNESNLIPVVLKNVRVSLNLGVNDFWARDLAAWDIREGYFVQDGPPQIKSIAKSGGAIQVTTTTQPGQTYRLEYTNALTGVVTWNSLPTNIYGNGNDIVLSDPSPGLARFYHVNQTP